MRKPHKRWIALAGATTVSLAGFGLFGGVSAAADDTDLPWPVIQQRASTYAIDGFEIGYLPPELERYGISAKSATGNKGDRSSHISWVQGPEATYGKVAVLRSSDLTSLEVVRDKRYDHLEDASLEKAEDGEREAYVSESTGDYFFLQEKGVAVGVYLQPEKWEAEELAKFASSVRPQAAGEPEASEAEDTPEEEAAEEDSEEESAAEEEPAAEDAADEEPGGADAEAPEEEPAAEAPEEDSAEGSEEAEESAEAAPEGGAAEGGAENPADSEEAADDATDATDGADGEGSQEPASDQGTEDAEGTEGEDAESDTSEADGAEATDEEAAGAGTGDAETDGTEPQADEAEAATDGETVGIRLPEGATAQDVRVCLAEEITGGELTEELRETAKDAGKFTEFWGEAGLTDRRTAVDACIERLKADEWWYEDGAEKGSEGEAARYDGVWREAPWTLPAQRTND
ncbi:KxYKxGKxW signal peptide domain-containing protein [Nocardiopsis halophila]|uniref:KxYKxGKxW signal peptide domain-containing protein n=1 Tax=Nocardiopsis halophila TaxID=141692 RepID=UPI00034896B4|nr:KxYKxGKxW signal peptide domain-containing protein [Nocardiopsis halophila]